MWEVVRWYAVFAAIGLGGVLPATLLFGRLHSGGVLFGRPFGLLVVTYVAWLAGASPMGYGTHAALLGLALLATWSAALALRRPGLLREARSRWRTALVGESLFLVVFAAILWGRSQAPDAVYTEKPMDLMLLAAVHEADRLPPEDSWFAGRPVSYYHLGHTGVDVLARLSGTPTGVAFNLGLASAGAAAAAAVFGLAGDAHALTRFGARRRPWLAGGAAALALVALGNLEGGLELLAANGVGGSAWAHLGVEGFPSGVAASGGVPQDFWWWWRATRVLPGVIAEFPAFSFVLGDLHAHVLALPLAVLALGVALTAFDGSRPQTWRVWRSRPGELAVAALLFAGLAMTNSWDAVLYGLVWLGAGAAAYVAAGWGLPGAVFGMARHLAVPAALAGVLAWPFLTTLEDLPLSAAPVVDGASDPVRFTLLWGPLVLPVLVSAWLVGARVRREAFAGAAVYAGAAVMAWVVAVVVSGNAGALAERGAGWLTLAGLVAGAAGGLGAAAHAYEKGERGRAAWLALAGAAALLVLGTELFHLVDALPGRMNTVFKFWFGAWLLMAVAAAGAVADAVATLEGRRAGFAGEVAWMFTAAVLTLCLLYTPAAVLARGAEGQRRGLDATAYLARERPADAAAIEWLRRDAAHDAVLLEAVGQSYLPTNLVSTVTGVPTVLGWPGHELTWRGDDPAVGQREAAVRDFYLAGAGEEALAIARRYGVTHVYLGERERTLYGDDVASRFEAWPVAFEAPGVRIVTVPVEGAASGASR